MQVEDRLVTKSGLPHDKNSNKIIILHTRNGIACISYVGLAYIRTKTMDDWIVEQIVGYSVDSPLGFRSGRTSVPDMGCALARVARSLNSEQARFSGEVLDLLRTTALLISGWQWNKKGWSRPFFALVRWDAHTSEFRLSYTKRHWYVNSKCIFKTRVHPASWLNQHQRQELVQQIGKSRTAEEVETAIVSTIKAVSRNTPPVVGPNCMRVLLPPPGSAVVLIKYISDDCKEKATEDNMNYFPWVVGPNVLYAPAVYANGSWGVRSGNYRIQGERLGETGVISFVRSQKRPNP
jgi:hypothetical protein